MPGGSDLVRLATKHVGEKYVLGSPVPKDNAQWKGPWDCAEFVSWCVYQVVGKLYGCDSDSKPKTADAYTGYWQRDSKKLVPRISIDEAAGTAGAIVLRAPAPGLMGHIAISDGRGGTVEAASSKLGVTRLKVLGRRWDTGLLIPELDFKAAATPPDIQERPTLVLRIRHPLMSGDLIKRVQRALKGLGFSPGVIDGIYGPHTAAAVQAFQADRGLVVDGEAGAVTLAALRVT